MAEALPLLCLHGLSTGDFVPALEQFLGSTADLNASTVTRLMAQWQDDAQAFNQRTLKGTHYVYCWVDGFHLKVRLEQDKVCLLGDDRRPRRQQEGTHRRLRRIARELGVVGRPAPGLQRWLLAVVATLL